MSERLGYTFYPKDFISDPDVMMMTSSQRGIYRDLIDIAYLSDNKIKYSLVQLAKYTNSTEQEVEEILKLKAKKFDNYYSIPSCDKRIKKAATNRENGSKGGRPIKPKRNPEHNPTNNPKETQTERQREREEEREDKNKLKESILNSIGWLESILMKRITTLDFGTKKLNEFLNIQEDLVGEGNGLNRNEEEIKNHFVKWFDLELKKEKDKPKETVKQYKYFD